MNEHDSSTEIWKNTKRIRLWIAALHLSAYQRYSPNAWLKEYLTSGRRYEVSSKPCRPKKNTWDIFRKIYIFLQFHFPKRIPGTSWDILKRLVILSDLRLKTWEKAEVWTEPREPRSAFLAAATLASAARMRPWTHFSYVVKWCENM